MTDQQATLVAPVPAGAPVPRPRLTLTRGLIAHGAMAGMVAAGATIAVLAAAQRNPLVQVPPNRFPAWVAGPLAGFGGSLPVKRFLLLVVAMWIGYAVVVAAAEALSRRAAIAGLVALNILFVLAPPLLSTDIFSYIDYARLGVLHHANPYVHTPAFVRHDPVFAFVGAMWTHVKTAYGPLFTVGTYPFAHLGLEGQVLAFKALSAVGSLGLVAVVWQFVARRGRDPRRAALIVGLNPVLLVYAVGGGHNDLLMLAVMTAGVAFALSDRERLGAAGLVVAAAVKVSAVVTLPFMLLAAARRRPAVLAAGAATAVITVIALVFFGTHGLSFFEVLRKQQALVSRSSFPNMVAHLAGPDGPVKTVGVLCRIALGLFVVALLVHVRRGGDWVTASGWALLAVPVTTTFLVPWYTLWALPLAAISPSRRLLYATLFVELLTAVYDLMPLLVT